MLLQFVVMKLLTFMCKLVKTLDNFYLFAAAFYSKVVRVYTRRWTILICLYKCIKPRSPMCEFGNTVICDGQNPFCRDYL